MAYRETITLELVVRALQVHSPCGASRLTACTGDDDDDERLLVLAGGNLSGHCARAHLPWVFLLHDQLGFSHEQHPRVASSSAGV